MSSSTQRGNAQTERLFTALVDQLKTPLLQISYDSELAHDGALTDIKTTATQALHLIETYILSTQQQELPLEPVTLSSVLYDVAQSLQPLAKQYGSDLDLRIEGRYGPVMAHRPTLAAGLVTIGQSLIEADNGAHSSLTLAVYKHKSGLSAGVFGEVLDLTPQLFRRAMRLYGDSRQPMPSASAFSGAGFYVAQNLFEQMNTTLRVAHHRKLTGLAASFLPSTQLQLV